MAGNPSAIATLVFAEILLAPQPCGKYLVAYEKSVVVTK
jgi:hypothetical protein